MGSEWMTNLPDNVKNYQLNTLAIPGSHDSGAYNLTTELSPGASSVFRIIAKIPFIGSLFKKILLRMSTTQNVTMGKQMELGIRHFDLRVSTKAGTKDLFLVHSVYGGKLKVALEEVKAFLDDHLEEVVILDFQSFYAMDATNHAVLISLIKSMFGSKMCEKKNLKDLTLKSITENKKQVICIYQHAEATSDKVLWPAAYIESPWPNTPSADKCIKDLTKYMDEASRVTNKFFVCQAVVTPDVGYILANLKSGSLKKLTDKLNPVFYAWLASSPTKWLHEPNIVIHDFVDDENGKYIKNVLALNTDRL